MRKLRFVLAAAGGAAALWGASLAAQAGGGPGCVPPTPAEERLVVHEWGTFTSMQGDGAALEGLGHEEEALPGFVYSRSKVRDCPLRAQGYKGLEVPATRVTQKMETPVIYFHSEKPRRVRVRVDFQKGVLTQWYPVSDLLGPPEGACDAGPLDVSKVPSSFLQWDVDVLGSAAAKPAQVPDVSLDDPWHFAREVEASWLRTVPRAGPERSGPVEAERYLFYRGLGTYDPGLAGDSLPGRLVLVTNGTGAPVGRMFALQVEGEKARFMPLAGAADGASSQVTFPEQWDPLDVIARKLGAALEQRLVDEGLRVDEARAMVRTWSRSWFRCEGTRVLWIVPRARVDAMLPLSIEPKPDETVRVLLGRLELISPETFQEVSAALVEHRSEDPVKASAAKARLDRCGRFLEPTLRHVMRRAKSDEVRKAAETLLAEMAGGC